MAGVGTVDVRVGEMVDGRYRIKALVARGGMAVVYQAWDVRLERTVAVKIIHPAYADDPSFVERFVREAVNIAQLSHPNVVAVFDQGTHQGLAYLVMEYVSGRTLRGLLVERGRLEVEEAVGILDSLLAGLEAAHRIGMVHRDVKPENVLIGDDGVVKVADFGLARLLASNRVTNQSEILGTVAYVAPEVVTSGASQPQTDVYAAGIVLFEMLTGSVPFTGATPVAVAYQHVNDDVPAPSTLDPAISADLDAVVRHATRRDSRARFADAAVMLDELRSAGIGSAAATARPVSRGLSHTAPLPTTFLDRVPEAAPPAARRTRRWLPIAAAVLALLLVVVGVVWWATADTNVKVPSVVGSTRADAESALREVDLQVRYGAAVFDEKVPAGTVVRQTPNPDAEVPPKSVVTLVASKGPQLFAVPTVVGKRRTIAEKALRDRNLKAQVSSAYDDEVSAGRVISSTPGVGTKLRRGSTVKISVSLGPKPKPPQCEFIPNLPLPESLRDRLKTIGC